MPAANPRIREPAAGLTKRKENTLLIHCLYNHRSRRRVPLLGLTVLFCIAALFIGGVHADPATSEEGTASLERDTAQSGTSMGIVSGMFFRPYPHRADIVIDAGDLGRYRFSEDTELRRIPRDVRIRRELVQLLNDVEEEVGRPVQILSGYRSEQHQIYLWAKWLKDNYAKVRALNRENHRTWAAWIEASQELRGCPPLATKHQTGDAVTFYWKTLSLDSRRIRKERTELIRELGGEEQYSARDRREFNIPRGDNALFEVTAYAEDDNISLDNPQGYPCFHVVYRPSDPPRAPRSRDVGVPERDDRRDTTPRTYKKGDILLIAVDKYYYLGEVMEDTHRRDRTVKVWFFVEEIRDELRDEVSIDEVSGVRPKPEAGWGKAKVILEYYNGKEWKHAEDVLVFRDYYRLPHPVRGARRLEFDQVRLLIAVH